MYWKMLGTFNICFSRFLKRTPKNKKRRNDFLYPEKKNRRNHHGMLEMELLNRHRSDKKHTWKQLDFYLRMMKIWFEIRNLQQRNLKDYRKNEFLIKFWNKVSGFFLSEHFKKWWQKIKKQQLMIWYFQKYTIFIVINV